MRKDQIQILAGKFLKISFFAFYGFHVSPISAETSESMASAEVRKQLQKMVEDREAPGLQYQFSSAEDPILSFEAGKADILNTTFVSANTSFLGFSVTKTFTALAILQLAKEKKLSLDDPLSKYLDYLPYEKSPSIRQTLNHTGGFSNPIPLSWSHLEAEHSRFSKSEFIYKILKENNKLQSEPGEKFKYSNLGFLLLGEVIERVSGLSYQEYIQKNIISKLSLKEGELLGFESLETPFSAIGYIKRFSILNAALGWFIDRDQFISGSQEGWSAFRKYYIKGDGYGGIVGNAKGFSKYLQSFIKSNGVFSEYALELFGPITNQKKFPVNLGWYRGELNGTTFFAHAGGGGGFYCEIRVYPSLSKTSVLMTNRTGVSDERLLDEIDLPFIKAYPEKRNKTIE